MELELFPLEKDKETALVWDDYVPIVKHGREIDVYIMNEILDPCNYSELCQVIRQASSKEVIRLHLNTAGGRLDSTNMIISAMENSDAYIIGVLSGSIASAGTMLALACDEIECSVALEFMIHYFSGGTLGKGHEIKSHNQFIEKHMPMVFREYYKGFLSNKEIDDVINGKDIWLNGAEVLERFKNMKLGVTNE